MIGIRKYMNHGYIIVVCLLFLSMVLIVVNYLVTRGTSYVPLMHTMIEREKAKMLALSGIQIGISQLAAIPEEKKEKTTTSEKKVPQQEAKQFLFRLVPILNKKQEFILKEEIDGIDGSITLVLTSEQGKIDINNLYDVRKKTFKLLAQQNMLKYVFQQIEKQLGGRNLFTSFEKFLKNSKGKIDDVTQLLTIPEFAVFNRALWYEPAIEKEKNQKRLLFLTDIFTVFSNTVSLDPLVFSPSMQTILDLNMKSASKESIEKLITSFKFGNPWSKEWNTLLAPIYGKELNSLPKGIESILKTSPEPVFFSVLSYGTVGTVTQRVLAIVARKKTTTHNGRLQYTVEIRRLYWL